MRFEDLPRDWAQRPITDPDVFEGVADLIATQRSRADGATYVLLCHPNGRLLQPVCLPDDPRLDAAGVADGVRRLLEELVRQGVHDVAVVLARPGHPEGTARDRALRDLHARACRSAGVRLHAVAVAGSEEVLALPLDDGCAAA